MCEKVCPIINIDKLKKNDFEVPKCYAAIHKNLEVRFDSTSGGLFSAFAEKMYRDRGYVGGAIYDENFNVKQFISNDKKDLLALRSSKYTQSSCVGFFKQVKEILKSGEKSLSAVVLAKWRLLGSFYASCMRILLLRILCVEVLILQ